VCRVPPPFINSSGTPLFSLCCSCMGFLTCACAGSTAACSCRGGSPGILPRTTCCAACTHPCRTTSGFTSRVLEHSCCSISAAAPSLFSMSPATACVAVTSACQPVHLQATQPVVSGRMGIQAFDPCRSYTTAVVHPFSAYATVVLDCQLEHVQAAQQVASGAISPDLLLRTSCCTACTSPLPPANNSPLLRTPTPTLRSLPRCCHHTRPPSVPLLTFPEVSRLLQSASAGSEWRGWWCQDWEML